MPDSNTRALVSALLRMLQDYVRTDEESTAAEWTSDDARATPWRAQRSKRMKSTPALYRGLEQTQLVKLSLSPSVAQPSPTSVMRRSVQNTFEPVLSSCSAVLCAVMPAALLHGISESTTLVRLQSMLQGSRLNMQAMVMCFERGDSRADSGCKCALILLWWSWRP